MSEEIIQQQQQRPVVPHIEVVNEIQIVVSNKKDNPPRSSFVNVTTPNDNKDIRKCASSRSSKTDITVTTPTTATLDTTTTKQITTKSERRTSKSEKEKSDTGSTICVCGKLLKRVKELLEAKETKTKKCEEDEIILPVRYYPESLSALSSATSFSEYEIKKMYRSFKASCPTGFIREDTFKDIYSQFFPFGVSTAQYAHYVFNSIDRDSNGSVSFEEFVLNLSTLSRGSLDEKLKWTFQLYDVNGDGFISREEMTEVMTSVYELMGRVPEGCKEENQIKEKVDNMFKKMDLNADDKISLDEFLISCHNDDYILRSIAVFQTVF